MFNKISRGRVIAWDLANTDLMRPSIPNISLTLSLIRSKNWASEDKLLIIVIKKMELTVLTEIDTSHSPWYVTARLMVGANQFLYCMQGDLRDKRCQQDGCSTLQSA